MSGPFVTIDLEAVKHNALTLKSTVKQKQLLAMVKADAYGHGIVEVAKTLEPIVDTLGVARMDEAITLRNNGIKKPILLMTGVYSQADMDMACRLGVDLVLHQPEHLNFLKAVDKNSVPKLWIKVGSCMHRLGYPISAVDDVVSSLKAMGIEPFAFMTHLPAIESDDVNAIKKQLEPFYKAVKKYNKPLSISNSAGISHHLDYMLESNDIFRPGRVLYGLSPSNDISTQSLGLKPVMSFFATVIAKDHLSAGQDVGYERAYTTTEHEAIAIINVGYGDGYPKTTKGFVKFKDFICPIRGWVSMDMMAVSIPQGCEMQLGDTIQLWGEGMPIETLSKVMGRSTADMIMPLASRVKRIYIPVS
jgi:alanine racemase